MNHFTFQHQHLALSAFRRLANVALLACVLLFWMQSAEGQEAVKVYEFSAYEVEVWLALDPNLDVSDLAKSRFAQAISDDLERVFQAAWRTEVKLVEPELRSRLAREIDTLKLDDLSREELVLMVNRDLTSSVRTLENAVEKVTEFSVLPEHKAKIDAEVAKAAIDQASAVAGMIRKLKVTEGGLAAIISGLENKTIQAALVPRSSVKSFDKIARQISVLLPWQTDSLLIRRDKIMMVHVGRSKDGYFVKARELDCGLQFMGPTIRRETTTWSFMSRVATSAIASAFAPIARVESAQSKTAELRLKAGGLIVSDDNPALVRPGDLMQPVVRRDGNNGVPNLLEPLPWTYAAIIKSDGIKMSSNVYAYSGGPGLQGRNNRRTQRLLLRVRPVHDETDIQVVVRSTGRPQGGCAVYERDLITDKFTLLGKTDWRGRFTLQTPKRNSSILPEAIRAAKEAAEKKAKEAAAIAAASATVATPTEEVGTEGDQSEKQETPKPSPPAPTASPAPAPAATVDYDDKLIALRQPLVQLYVKSGDVVLARLPVVPGISELEVAQLADDSRRLEAEAFMRGFQGEVLDLIGLRTLLSTRVQRLIKQNKKAEAEKVMAELRGLKDYAAMVETLDKLQRKVLDDSAGAVSIGAKTRIDKMLQTTRDMMQKFLQNDLVRDAEAAVAKGAVAEESATTNLQAAGSETACSIANLSFTLPTRYKFINTPRPPNMPSTYDLKIWASEGSPKATLSATSDSAAKNASLSDADLVKAMINFVAGTANGMGGKIDNVPPNPQPITLGGIRLTQIEWTAKVNDQTVFAFTLGAVHNKTLIMLTHLGFDGDPSVVKAEILKHLSALKAN